MRGCENRTAVVPPRRDADVRQTSARERRSQRLRVRPSRQAAPSAPARHGVVAVAHDRRKALAVFLVGRLALTRDELGSIFVDERLRLLRASDATLGARVHGRLARARHAGQARARAFDRLGGFVEIDGAVDLGALAGVVDEPHDAALRIGGRQHRAARPEVVGVRREHGEARYRVRIGRRR